MNGDRPRLDKRAVRRAFSRAAAGYDAGAFLQREICERCLQHLDPIALQPARVLDLGAGTGYALPHLRRRYPRARLCALDLSLPMLERARRAHRRWFGAEQFVCGDADRLPFADGSFELVFSSLMLQWSADLDRTLAEIRRVLRADGLLLFASFGPDTLKELRASTRALGAGERVHAFIDMHDVGDALLRAGFREPVLDTETITVTYRKAAQLLRDLKSIGATNAAPDRPRGLQGRALLARLEAQYARFRRAAGSLPASYEVVYGHCWVGRPGARPQDGSTVARFPLEQLRRR